MPDTSKYISRNLVNLLPGWLIHFLWYLWAQIDPESRGPIQVFDLQAVPDGQSVTLRQDAPPYEQTAVVPCPVAVIAKVVVQTTDGRIVMRLQDVGSNLTDYIPAGNL